MPLILLGLLIALASIAPAAAQSQRPGLETGPVRFATTVVTTPVSGQATSATRRLEASDPSQFGLYGARFAERSDEPCHVVALFESLRDQGDDQQRPWSDCGDRGPSGSSLTAAGFGDVGANDQRAFVTGLEACVTPGLKLEGVRFSGMRVTERGRLRPVDPTPAVIGGAVTLAHTPNDPEPADPLFWRANCRGGQWQGPVACPSGAAATALVLHLAFNAPRGQVMGLALECRQVLRPVTALQPQ